MRKVIIILLFLGHYINANTQGCSDPGLCTIGTLNSGTTVDTVSSINFINADIESLLNSKVAEEKYKIGIDAVHGSGEKRIALYSIVLRSSLRVTEKLLINVKIPYNTASGTLGTVGSTGDITLSVQNTFKSGNNKRLAYTVGCVIPTNNSNLMDNGASLPMAYQSSLGAFNVLGGLSFSYKGWGSAIGYQQSFGSNGNEFTTENLERDQNSADYDPLNEERFQYISSRHLTRGSDVILRLEKRIQLKNFNFLAGVLPIYRLNNSTTEMLDGSIKEIVGSNGLTLNLTGGINYNIKNKWRIISNVGFPVVQRKFRPDGLTRHYVIIAGITYRAW